jgi:hypothetical protein
MTQRPRTAGTRNALLSVQRRWAAANNIAADARGYVSTYVENLQQPLSAVALDCLTRGSGSELRDGKRRPAKIRALHSSAALAVNVFDYWGDRDCAPLMQALGAGPAKDRPRFEVQYPTGLEGEPPNLDVVIELSSGMTLAIESKFCEWVTPRPLAKAPFKDKYFFPDPGLWSRYGLPECQKLAREMHCNVERFQHLDAPQLLKHALGLAKTLGTHFCLWYLYYDWPCPEADGHSKDIARFEARVGDELKFHPLTYQELFARLREGCGEGDAEYLKYLYKRYFDDAA